jgi:hypothetical protein
MDNLLIFKNLQVGVYFLRNTFPSTKVFSFYIFTLLMFRKLNKPQITRIKH